MELAKRGLGKQLDRERREEERLLAVVADLRARTPVLALNFIKQTSHEAATLAKPFEGKGIIARYLTLHHVSSTDRTSQYEHESDQTPTEPRHWPGG